MSAEQKKKKRGWKIWAIVIAAVLVIWAFASMGGGESDEPVATPSAATSASSAEPAGEDSKTEPEKTTEDVPTEYKSALKSAESYSETMHMSKAAIYDQLTSDFDQFTKAAAQYAVDNVEADWKQNALESAKSYQETMSMSPAAIRDQLVSEFDQFTPEEADYAIANLD